MTAPTEPAPPAEDAPPVKPGPRDRWWEETPAEAARYDRLYWNRDED